MMKGAAAGLFGAATVGAILMVNAHAGWLPQLANIMPGIGATFGLGAAAGWLLHFASGAVFGALLAWLDPDLPGDSLRQRGIVLAAIAWLPAMLFVMPLAGLGIFAMNAGVLTILALFALYLFFGGVTGSFYGWLLLQSVPLHYRAVHTDLRNTRVVTQSDLDPGFDEATLVPQAAASEPRVEEPAPKPQLPMPRAEPLLRLVPKDEAPEVVNETEDARILREIRARQSRQ
jgi:hypothetical protein